MMQNKLDIVYSYTQVIMNFSESNQNQGFTDEDIENFQLELFFHQLNELSKADLITELMDKNAKLTLLASVNKMLTKNLELSTFNVQQLNSNTNELITSLQNCAEIAINLENQVQISKLKAEKYDLIIHRIPLIIGALAFSIISSFALGFYVSNMIGSTQAFQIQTR